MRRLTEEELSIFFDKLSKYIGPGIKALIESPDGRWCFRLHRDRVYYISEHMVKHASALPKDQLVSLGCLFGKFTKSKKFRLHVTCLDYVAKHAQHRVWLKPSAEQAFLYGNHVNKAGLGRITEDAPKNQGCVVLNMADVPLGFGTLARSTAEVRKLDPQGVVAFNQADTGEVRATEPSWHPPARSTRASSDLRMI